MNTFSLVYTILSAIAILLLVALLVYMLRHQVRHKRFFVAAVSLSIIFSMFYLGYVHTQINRLAYLSVVGYLVLVTGMAYVTLYFIMRYTGYNQRLKPLAVIFLILTCFDAISQIVNGFTHHLFYLEQIEWHGHLFWHMSRTPWSITHNVVFFSMLLMGMLLLIVKAANSPVFYRGKYIAPTILLGLILALNVVNVVMGFPVDYSALIYVLFVLFSNYYVNYGVATRLVSRIMRDANYYMDDGMVYYDIIGNVHYANLRAQQYFGEDKEHMAADMREYLTSRLESDGVNQEKWDETFIVNGKKVLCEVVYHELRQKNVRIGQYLRFHDKTEETRLYKEQRYRATHDLLTGIYNRSGFFEAVDELKASDEARDSEWLLISTDIKDFKLVNELLGEERGDELLRMEAQFITENAHANTLYGRVGDDKFAIFMDKSFFYEEVFTKGFKDIRKRMASNSYHIHFHVGIYVVTDLAEPVSTMYDKTVFAIQTIAEDYHQIFAYFDNDTMGHMLQELDTVEDYDQIIDDNRVFLRVQPQFDSKMRLRGLATQGYIELMGQEISVLSLTERSGSIYRLDQYIWEMAIETLSHWQQYYSTRLYVSIRLNAKDIYYLNVLETITTIATQYNVNPNTIHVELTENVLMLDPKKNMQLIMDLQKKGFHVVIDDFGNGYSSLNVMKDMHLNAVQLHLDAFYSGESYSNDEESSHSGSKSRGSIIFTNVIEMTKALSIRSTITNIQHRKEYEALPKSKSIIYQGDYLCKAFDVGDFDEKVNENQWRIMTYEDEE